jgi:hypothetical protein
MNTNEQHLSGPLLWIGISLGVIFAILVYTPFPLSIPLAIAAFILLNFHFRKKVIKRMNTMFGNSSSYSCINCGTSVDKGTFDRSSNTADTVNFYIKRGRPEGSQALTEELREELSRRKTEQGNYSNYLIY